MTYSNNGVHFNSHEEGLQKFTNAERETIVREYLPRIKVWALRAKSTLPESVDIDELYSAASLGLIECLDKFDKSRNTSFGTYVEHRVKGAILDALRGLDFLSRNARTKVKQVESATEELRQKLGRIPHVEEIAIHMNITESDIYKIYGLQSADKPLSLDDNICDDDGLTLIDFLQSNGLTPEEEAVKVSLTTRMAEEIDKLSEKERLVVSLYYYEELTMKEVAQVLDLTESRVSQLHTSAMQKMKRRLKDIYD